MDLSREDNLRVEVLENATVVQFASGPIRDEKKIYDALESLNQYAASNGDSRLVLDLTNIEYFSSCGLGLLVSLLKKLRMGGGTLKLCCVNEKILDLFKVRHLTNIFDVHEDQQMALVDMGVVNAC